MLPRIALIAFTFLCFLAFSADAQPKPAAPKLTPQPAIAPVAQPAPKPLSFKKLNAGLEYAMVVDKPTSPRPKEGDLIKVNMQSACNNRLIYSTYQNNKGKPVEFGVNKPNFKGDLIEAIMLMTPGDSLVCLVDADALYKSTKNKKPDFIKNGDKIQYYIKLVSIKTKEQAQKEQQAAFDKQMKEQMAKQQKEAAKMKLKDDKELQAHFKKNNISPIKTASGLYYTIEEEGSGVAPVTGDTAVMNYTGTLLDGTKFDSNEDSVFSHVTPFKFALGRGQVIKGWDEGIALLKKSTKATLYIPSTMAYGAQARPGGGANPKGIPANSCLVFKVALMDVIAPAPVLTPAAQSPMNSGASPDTPQQTPVQEDKKSDK
jgi:FKBP-type peptidyl-prolyl cis-trans isomerase FkpA